MKRRQEVEIMKTTLSEYGIFEDNFPNLEIAVELGLKRIRSVKFEERKAKKTVPANRRVQIKNGGNYANLY